MRKLKKYFGTDGIRGYVGNEIINPEFILKLGWAIGSVLYEEHGDSNVLIGKDTRISGYLLESVLEAGLSSAGINPLMLGPMPTPAIAYLTRTFRAKAGIEISASHNPYYDNGIKIFSFEGKKLSDDFEYKIEKKLQDKMILVNSLKLGKARRVNDALGRYIEFCKSTFGLRNNLNGMKIVVDCANGATYHAAPTIFSELGATVIAIGIEPNGFNINDHCGSTYPAKLSKSVIDSNADIGIAFDGDGDRVIMVDHFGEIVDGDELLFIIAKNEFIHDKLSGGIVGTTMSNLGLQEEFNKLGINFKRTHVGDRYIIEELYRNNWILGGEQSGHIIHLGYTTTGDGIISALQVLRAICDRNSSLRKLKTEFHKYPQILININCKYPNKIINNKIIKDAIKNFNKLHKRILFRASGTEPMIRIMIEGNDLYSIDKIGKKLTEIVRNVIQKTII